MANAFTADYGIHQGRIPSSDAAAGSYVMQLGHALPGRTYSFNPGDRHLVSQTAVITGSKMISATLALRGVASMPAGASWTVRLLVDAVVRASRVIDARSRRLIEFGVNVSTLSGSKPVGFDLVITGGTGPYYAELPGASIDAVVTDTIGQALVIMNRDPEPGETNVPLGGPLRFDIENTNGTGAPDISRTDVYVDDEPVCIGGVFQAGWTSSSRTMTFTSGWSFALSPTVPLTSSKTYAVRVVTAQIGGPTAALDTTWTFTTIDLLAPTVVFAFSTSLLEVRVGFNEAMRATDASAVGDALDPAAYTLALAVTDTQPLPPYRMHPAVVPNVVSVARESDTTVILTLDKPATRRAIYQLTVTGVMDLAGNASGPPNNTALFEGFVYPTPADRDFDVFSLFPEDDQAADEGGTHDLYKLCACVQETADLLLYLIDRWVEILDPDTAPEAWLDLMLGDLGNPFRFALTVVEKRRLAQLLVDIYRTKGVGPGIVDAIRLFLGIEVTLNVPAWSPVPIGEAIIGDDWILGSNDLVDLLTFQVIVPVQLDDDTRRKMSAIIDYMMSEREFFVILEPAAQVGPPDHWQLGFSMLGFETFVH